MKKSQRMFAAIKVDDPFAGVLDVSYLRRITARLQDEAWREIGDQLGDGWKRARRNGWRIVPVNVTWDHPKK